MVEGMIPLTWDNHKAVALTNDTSQKRGKPWNIEEEAALWKLRRRGMEFDQIAVRTVVIRYSIMLPSNPFTEAD